MVNWVVDTYILESRSTVGDLLASIRKAGHNLHTTKYVPFQDEQDYGPEEWVKEPTVLYGTHGFLNKCKRSYVPGAFGVNSNMHCNMYYAHIPPAWMLNHEYIFTNFADLKRDPQKYFILFGVRKLFIRPNNGFKTFAGMVITKDDADFELSSTQQLTSVMPETFVLIAPAEKITGEFRFVISNGEVVDGSEYRWDGVLDIRRDWPDEAYQLARKMAEHTWQPDSVYCCDVAMTLSGPRIVEINSFACAGLYACDKDLIVKAISLAAEKEFSGG